MELLVVKSKTKIEKNKEESISEKWNFCKKQLSPELLTCITLSVTKT